MQFLRQNTAVIISVGPFYDKTDGVTIETGLTITNERITLTADTDAGSAPTNILDNVTGATSGTANDLNYITGNDAGMMQLELAAADTNRVGRMLLSITDAANHVPVFHEYFVLPAAIFDWLTGVIVPLPANVTTIAGSAVSTSTAQLGVNAVNLGGTAQTGRDLGVSVLLSSGTGTGQLDFTSGVVKSNLAQILGTALTETAGLLAGGFKKFFNVSTPTGTLNSIPDAVAGATNGLFIAGTNAATTVTTALTTTFTGNLTGSVGSVTGAVGSVTGNVGGNVTGSVGSVAAGGIAAASFAAGAIDAAAIAADAIGSSELAASAVTEIQSGLATSASIAALNNLSAAQVNAEVVDALATDTYAEPGQGAPAATTTLSAKIGYLYKLLRNKIEQTATTLKVYDDAGTTVDQKATVSDDATTYTRGELGTGP